MSCHVIIACGGTGGHLYPGMAVGRCLVERGATVTLMVSSKAVDQQAVRGQGEFEVATLPAVAFGWRQLGTFLAASRRSVVQASQEFRQHSPDALLAMGGFTCVAPALAAWRRRCPILLHEGNAVPGRANRWLARLARRAYVYFPEAGPRLRAREVRVAGMPVRREFQGLDARSCRLALGLDPDRPVLLVTGGSQGASGINDAVLSALPDLTRSLPGAQFLHLTGARDEARVRAAYAAAGVRSLVRAFLTEMDLALGAARAAITRAGASSAAELAAVRLPAVLIPYPHAADDHQTANARALERSGAARVLLQSAAAPARLVPLVVQLMEDDTVRQELMAGLEAWYRPDADAELAEDLLALAGGPSGVAGRQAAAVEARA